MQFQNYLPTGKFYFTHIFIYIYIYIIMIFKQYFIIIVLNFGVGCRCSSLFIVPAYIFVLYICSSVIITKHLE